MVDAVYHPDVADDPTAILDRLADQTGPMLAFHTLAMAGAVLLVVFAADLANKTVRNAVSSIYAKLHAAGRAEAIITAREAGYGRD